MPIARFRPALLSLALAVVASPALADDLQTQVDRIVQPLMHKHAIPGMAVAVFADGQAHYFTYGVASKADRQPVSHDTLFEVGSLSKTYTATLAALASAEGTLDLNAPASRYQPALANTPLGAASVLELGAYSADCLPLQFPDEVTSDAQTLVFFQQWQTRAERGTQRCYSNPSLGLFGDLAARAQGKPFAELMGDSVLPRLGLQHTYLEVPDAARSAYAQGYDAQNRPVRVNPGPFANEAYGIKTNVVDALRFVRLQLQADTLDAPLRQAISLTHQGYFEVGAMRQGLGWERYAYPVTLDTLLAGNGADMIRTPQPTRRLDPPSPAEAAAWYNKTGSTAGFGAYAAFIPAKGAGIVLLANRNYPNEARVEAAYRILSGL
ncbi:Beta-lactamase [Pseudomonas reidholzensis]|uniref:Beta-lactamase n=1 Tax=Pseudomonas reidholzensis TaxID=1785162 RepID=A0A383RV05_9PSED|nr:class C beta-lactamase [Pseudomonas reidholzensis]SYX90326.1 Beta-lactamase [Pseudomonas reidholzensis]